MLEIALISDIHYGPDRGTKKGSLGKELFEEFNKWLVKDTSSVLIDLGDRISDVDLETDRSLAREVGTWFKKINIPQYHLLGNHDLEELSVEENEELIGYPMRSQSFDLNGYHLVLWDTLPELDKEKGFSLREDRLDWLKADLAQATLPSVVFTHLPLDNGSMKGNFYFEKAYPTHAYFSDADGERIREVLELSKKVQLCINGHAHWNAYHCIDGIHYITIPSLTELFPTFPNTTNAWAKLAIGTDIHLRVFGNLPIEYKLPLRCEKAVHWLNVDKSYTTSFAKPL